MSQWIRGAVRLPLVIRGARQVGKTWLVRDLALRERRTLMEVNLERNPEYARYFESSDPRRIHDDLALALSVEAPPGKTLLFLDEIQSAPEVIAKLRWFAEEMPELPVVAAGSLLEFALRDFAHSVPVGRIRYAHVEPLAFPEYLDAQGQATLRKRLESWNWGEELGPAVHDRASEWFQRYLMVGGMPAVVDRDARGEPARVCREVQRDLIQTCRDDFAKYSGRVDHRILDRVLHAVLASFGKKFVYSRAGDDLKHHQVKKALELLAMARLCDLISHSAANGIPLAAEASDRISKVALLDVGLAHGLWNTPAGERFPRWEDLAPQIRGGLVEQISAQQLRTACGDASSAGKIYHWRREGGRAGEIDFLIELSGRIVPVEVKSGAVGAMKSLHQFMFDKKLELAIRLDSNPPSRQSVDVKTTQGDRVRYLMLNLPHYLTWRLPELAPGAAVSD